MQVPFLIISFFIVAFIYSSVGFGGGSSYTALLVLSGISFSAIAPISLLSNIIVVSGNSLNYAKAKVVDFRIFAFLAITSVPCAYIGGKLPISKTTFIWILIIALLLSGVGLLLNAFKNDDFSPRANPIKPIKLSIIGAVLGFAAGITGIGGGILLSPILYYLRAATSKQIAATSSLFILVNSVSGLIGQLQKHPLEALENSFFVLPLAVLLGGQIGNRLSLKLFSSKYLALGTAVLVIIAAFQLMLKQMGFI